MYLAYFDESGDEGFPKFSSEIFVLSSLYMHFQNWKGNFDKLISIRKSLKEQYGLPVRTELKIKQLLLNKHPFDKFRFDMVTKKAMIDCFVKGIAQLDIDAVNVVINKRKVKDTNYIILDRAINYNIQRIENDLHEKDPAHKFMIITDEGRVGKMRKTTRRIQKINFIPSKFGTTPYRKEIEKLIEDPLPKKSQESYFVQTVDTIAWLVFMYVLKIILKAKWANRLEASLTIQEVQGWLEILKQGDVLNLKASPNDYGIVIYPK